jgi:hypothetical protein
MPLAYDDQHEIADVTLGELRTLSSALERARTVLYFGTGPAVAFGGSGLGSQTFWTEGAGVRYLIPNASHPLLLDVKYLYGNNTSTNGLVNNKNFQFVGASVAFPFNW